MPINKKYFVLSIAVALFLCATQTMGSTLLILGCLVAFLGLLGWACMQDFTLPILLFFLPWSPLLKINPDTFSVYTFGMVLVCAISVLKNWTRFKRYHIVVAIFLLALTLFSKLLDGSMLAFEYIAFIMLILLFPVVKEEWISGKYDLFQTVSFFSAGIILAALCAQWLAASPNIARYINVASYSTIVRLSGFYGDSNFYTAQITAALGGCLVMILQEITKGRAVFMGALIVLLVYCGFLSGSKSFVLVSATILIVWVIALLRIRGRMGTKIALLVAASLVAVYIASSALFGGLIEVMVTRFSNADDMAAFTTGRTLLWKSYIKELYENPKILILGRGFTDIKVNSRASHNTILQAVYQLGLLGVPALIVWIGCFFKRENAVRFPKKQRISLLILLLGLFMPWMAIDALFFDEFFLLQWVAFVGIQQLRQNDASGSLAVSEKVQFPPPERSV